MNYVFLCLYLQQIYVWIYCIFKPFEAEPCPQTFVYGLGEMPLESPLQYGLFTHDRVSAVDTKQ